MTTTPLPEASCLCGWSGAVDDAETHPCTLPGPNGPPDDQIVARVELIEGWPATALGIGIWRNSPDGQLRLFLEGVEDWPFSPALARQLADRLREVADLAERGEQTQ